MIAVHCPRHDTLVLLADLDIEELHHSADGIHLTYTCTCGWHGTGRSRLPRRNTRGGRSSYGGHRCTLYY